MKKSLHALLVVGALTGCARRPMTLSDAGTRPMASSPPPSAPVPPPTGSLEVLAREQNHPKFVALLDRDVVFTVYEAGVVRRVPKRGGVVTTLLTGIEDPYGIAASAATVFVAARATSDNGGAIFAIDPSGKSRLIAREEFPSAVAVDGKSVSWLTRDAVVTAPFVAGRVARKPTRVAQAQAGPHGLAARDGVVAWSNYHDGTVMRATVAGEISVLARGLVNPAGVAFAGNELVVACTGDGTIRAVALSGAPVVRTLAADQPFVTELATSDADVYFTTAAGVVGRVSLASDGGAGAAILLAVDQGSPTGIAVDDASVYWANERAGTIMKRTPR